MAKKTIYTAEKMLSMMHKNVEKDVRVYKSDFYDYDVPALSWGVPVGSTLVWFTRECGTCLCSSRDYFRAALANWKPKHAAIIRRVHGGYEFTRIAADRVKYLESILA